MTYSVRWTEEALEDLDDPPAAQKAIDAIERAAELLEYFPFSCRVAARRGGTVLRELIIPFGARGYVALFHVEARTVTIAAVRHQREDDYY